MVVELHHYMIYISGKITAPTREEELKNLEKLAQKKEELTKQGLECFNPGELEIDGDQWEFYLCKDLRWIIENRPTLYFLDGWKESRGCRLEHEMAVQLGLPMIFENYLPSP